MGHTSAKRKAGNGMAAKRKAGNGKAAKRKVGNGKAAKGRSVQIGSTTSQECSHENTDVRLQRRLKRRCSDHQSFNQNSNSNATSARLGSLGSGDNDSDLRSERRLRRERMSNQCYNPKSRSKASKAIKKNIAGEKSELLKPPSFSNIRTEFVDENGVTKLIDYDVEEDMRPSMRFGSKNQLLAFGEDVYEDHLEDVDEDHLEAVDEDDSKDVDEEDFLTFPNNEDSYIKPVSRDKEDQTDYCIKWKPCEPSVHSNLEHGGTSGNSNLKHGLDADSEQEDEEIEYLKYLDTIDDYENTMPKKSDKVEEIQGGESNQEDEGDGICEDYHAYLDFLEKEGEETMFDVNDFAEQMKLAKDDDLKSLNLLRGFFHWLKNVADDIVAPWKDPSLLKVLPGN
uniref:Uncharacterized protein n=1 Tax=Cannabis sativa TaxID=3483 RepID=A0A803Q3B4_CANSA